MVPPKLPPATTGPKYGSMKSGWLLPDRLTASRPMEPTRQMMACMSLRAPAKSPVATVEIFWRVGLVSRSFRVGWFVFKMSKLQAPIPRASRAAAIAKGLVRMVRTPPGW